MKFHAGLGVCIALAISALQAHAQPAASTTEARWQPTIRAGVWSKGAAVRGRNEPAVGSMAALELRRDDPSRRVNFFVSVSGYSKRLGDVAIDFPVRKEYRQRADLVMLEVGGDISPLRRAQNWKLGLGVAGGSSRLDLNEITATGQPYNADGDGGWNRPSPILTARTHITVPTKGTWGIRLGLEAFQGVSDFSERGPNYAAHIGAVWLR